MTIGNSGKAAVDKEVRMEADIDGDCPALAAGRAPIERPGKPEWIPGKPGLLSRWFMRIAGVDMHLAGEMPADEQQQMKRVGSAIVFGAMFLGIAFCTALSISFGFDWWTIPMTLILSGIMWSLDTKFIGAHWTLQGLEFCRSRGLIPIGGWQDRVKRIVPIVIRWTFSTFIAYALTDFVMLKFFEADIERYLAEEYRSQNRTSTETATQQYEALISRGIAQIEFSDQRIDALGREHTRLAGTLVPTAVDIDRQIEGHLDRIKKLQVDKDRAIQSMNEFRRDIAAENHGIRLREENTGRAGQGTYFKFYSDMAALHEAIANTKTAEITTETKAIEDLRQQRTMITDSSATSISARLASIERNLREEVERRTSLTTNLQSLQDGRADSIAKQIRTMPNYVPMPAGILPKLEALSAIVARSALVANLIFSMKILIMLLESAGPLAKVVFTTPGLYQLSMALRFHDAAELEFDRRLSWSYWRVIERNRGHEALEDILAMNERRAIETQARTALHKIMESMRAKD
jgi:hypothetical protein